MSTGHGTTEQGRAGGAVRIDDEIDVPAIRSVGIWLAVIALAAFVIAYLFYRGLSSYERRTLDAKPSPIRAANMQRQPPGPRLQARPEQQLAGFRAAERARLTGWGWVDASKSVAHVPVEKAIAVVAANGLPDFSVPAEVTPP